MFDLTILEVAIGLALLYLLLSFACSGISELIAQWLSMRSNNLEIWVKQVFHDPNRLYNHPLIRGLTRGRKRPSYIPARTFALALSDLDLSASPRAKELLDSLTLGVNARAEETLAAIGSWFDGAMERVSGWYKRKAQYILLFVGAAIAGVLNVDSFEIAETLWRDDAVRASIVAEAEKVTESQDAESLKTPSEIANQIEEVEQLGIPIGWGEWPDTGKGRAAKIAGLGLTAIALSFGAPFWFTALNNLVNVRGSLKPKTIKEEEAASGSG